MLIGQPPFVSTNYMKILERVKNFKASEFKYPSHISKVAKDFLNCCLQEIPFERKNVFKLLQHPFIQLGEGINVNEFEQSFIRSPLIYEHKIKSAPPDYKIKKFDFRTQDTKEKELRLLLKNSMIENQRKIYQLNNQINEKEEKTFLQHDSIEHGYESKGKRTNLKSN